MRFGQESLHPPHERVPDRDYLALSGPGPIDDVLVAIDIALFDEGLDPPDVVSALWTIPASVFTLLTDPECKYPAQTLWRLVALYIEARREPSRWYELGEDDRSHLEFCGGILPPEDEDEWLGPRAQLLNYMLRSEGELPPWYCPLPEA